MKRFMILSLLTAILLSGNCFAQSSEAQGYITTAKEYWKVENYDQAIAYFKKALELSPNHLPTQFNIGKGYYLKAETDSRREDQDRKYIEAAYWFRKTADAGFARGQHQLGICYMLGTGVKSDPIQAAYWWRKAAEQGYPDAQYSLGNYYKSGPNKNITEAKRWLMKAQAGSDAVVRGWAQHSLDEIARGR